MSREKEADEEDGFFIETSSTDGLLEEHNGGEFAGLAARTNSSFYGTISLQDRSLTQSSKSSSFYLGDATSRQQLLEKIDLVQEEQPARLFESETLHRALADTVPFAYGIAMAEVWVVSDDQSYLYRPDDGLYVSPKYHPGNFCGKDCGYCRLLNKNHEAFIPPLPFSPGEGLPGALWSGIQRRRGGLQWRSVNALIDDPDTPTRPRAVLIADLGLDLICGSFFAFSDFQGIVIFSANSQRVDTNLLYSEHNSNYLMAATNMIGSCFAIRKARHDVAVSIPTVEDPVFSSRSSLRSLPSMSSLLTPNHRRKKRKPVKLPDEVAETKASALLRAWNVVRERVALVGRKSWTGGNGVPPPGFTWPQTSTTLIGVAVTLGMLTQFTEYMAETFGPFLDLPMGPFGALATLLFNLTSAPASQPRNSLFGQTIAGCIGIYFGNLVGMSPWLRMTLASTLSIGIMARLGVTHPPAGAAAISFAMEPYSWCCLPVQLGATCIAIVVGTLVNNFSLQRQYPSYWAFLDF